MFLHIAKKGVLVVDSLKEIKNNSIIKSILFLIIGFLFWINLQSIFIPKRFYNDNDTGKLKRFYNEEKNSIDVIIGGASHPARGIFPMEIYELFGIKAYNLATSAQSIDATYYTLLEALKNQHPKVFVFDISGLYFSNSSLYYNQFVLDDMPFGKNKIMFAKECIKSDKTKSLLELIIPLLGYHTRWKDLSQQDFNYIRSGGEDFLKGGTINVTKGEGISLDVMNSTVKELRQNKEKIIYEYYDGLKEYKNEEDILYKTDISDFNLQWLIKLQQLCEESNIEFLVVKIPAVQWPQSYSSAWTIEKYEKTRNICNDYGITYYDLLYDTDTNLDWSKDSHDGGFHLNFYGAQKVSRNLGNYLNRQYNLSREHIKKWDQDLIAYKKLKQVALLELEQDFVTYINLLVKEHADKIIFLTASDDITVGLNEEDIHVLRLLGLQADFSNAVRYSYVAVIDKGKVEYEALSNRPLTYKGICSQSQKQYELYSSGWWTVSNASIKLGGEEYAVNYRGLNIVVYDDDKDLILDSVAFDTYSELHAVIRNGSMIHKFEKSIEKYIIELSKSQR